jgi:hypothetical protein
VATGPGDNTTPDKIANLEENCKGEFIRVRLSPERDRYTVSIGADRTVQTVAVR